MNKPKWISGAGWEVSPNRKTCGSCEHHALSEHNKSMRDGICLWDREECDSDGNTCEEYEAVDENSKD